MDWNDGYVSDIAYPAAFFPEQSPAHLSFACVLNGVEPVALERRFTYLELGSGQGLTANILAASNPQGQFYAVDFNPGQVAAARQLAGAAQLDNLSLLESSFAELAAGEVALPQLDFITMYGVYSWVTAENRRHIVKLIERYLKPGGIVYVNYNAMPGWTSALPLQRLILEYADNHPNARQVQVEQARQFVDSLAQSGAAYFNGDANLQHRMDSIHKDKTGYLAHEYMNRGWQPLYHADVARELADAKLDYIGSAELSRAFPHLFLTPQQQELLDTIADPALRETIKDYLQNTSFREDIFIRGGRRMSAARQAEWLGQTGLALTTLRSTATLDLALPIGRIKADADLYLPVLDALARQPQSLTALAALPELAGKSLLEVAEIAALLTASGQACVYFLCSGQMSNAPAQRMNLAVAQQSRFDDHYQALASPLLGNGVKSGLVQRLIYRALSAQPGKGDADAIARQVRDIMQVQGHRLIKDGKPLESAEETLAELQFTTAAILQHRLPIWRQLSVL
ncbi:class I SAM-dependent methyltransferase [Collimonas sp.]|jgi:predicted O-methyltransferase YrrM|uniref:class I SAM-dependent methyltransferase n=1 Tax=Collimonas sp. TaxID=1963772 RepID=UPI002B567B63|nr:class I SAM-dependent methyltransferase [Collimonas sp.]HWW05959.1 class I SAM-dependent methyltransferase [Collimonas sp.]